MVPLIAMQFTDEVVWTLGDFVVAAVLLMGTGVSYEFLARKAGSVAYRSAVGLALAAALFLVWMNLAVGIIGSEDNPSPSWTYEVEVAAAMPTYTYNPKINFQQGENTEVLTIPPGPNGPVGSMWIALSKPTYGIHGTPEPSLIDKTGSHGCVRLTNWDAEELAAMVSRGVTVEFLN